MKQYTNCVRIKDNIYLRGVDIGGKRVVEKLKYQPTLFVKSQQKSNTNDDKKWYTVFDERVYPINFDSMYAATDFQKQYKDVQGFDIFGSTNYVYPFLNERFNEIDFNSNLIRVGYIDIETETEFGFPDVRNPKEEITLITIKFRGTFYVWGTSKYGEYKQHRSDVRYVKCKDEVELFTKFMKMWQILDLDIVTHWNGQLFDMPYIHNRVVAIMGPEFIKKLSPYGIVQMREMHDHLGNDHEVVDIYGITSLDYMDLYKKFGYNILESYSLNFVCYSELGEEKTDHSQFVNFKDFYTNDWQLFTEYNIRDVELIEKLNDKKKLLELVMVLAYIAKANFIDVFSAVRMWDCLIHNFLHPRGKVVPSGLSGEEKTRQIAGGFVKDPQIGEHLFVCSFDATSLYPKVDIQYNISPEKYVCNVSELDFGLRIANADEILAGYYSEPKLVNYLQSNNFCITGSGAIFKQDSMGFIPQIMTMLFEKRKAYKDLMLEAEGKLEDNKVTLTKEEIHILENEVSKYNSLQMAMKILLNSGYGALSNQYNRWYNDILAEAITLSGQMSIKWVENSVNTLLDTMLDTKGMDYIVAIDTDSTYIRLAEIIKKYCKHTTIHEQIKFMDNFCNNFITPQMKRELEKLRILTNCKTQEIHMKRELLSNKAIWTGKKHYIINMYVKESVWYDKPKLKMMGIEAIKTSTPSVCRKMIKDSIDLIMNSDERSLQEFIKETRETYDKLGVIDIAFPRSCNNVDKYVSKESTFIKGTPIQSRAAIIYNKLLKDKKLDQLYQSIKSGDKIKYCYLTLPNIIQQNAIGFLTNLPPEFKLDKYIDRELMFEKSFLGPVKLITDKIGWAAVKKPNLLKFFQGL